MSGEPEKQRPSIAFWITGLMLLTAIYLGSLGPLVGAWERGWIPGDVCEAVFQTVYYPIAYVDENTSFFQTHPVGEAYSWYVELWAEGG